MKENSIEEDIKMLEKLDYLLDDVYSTGLVNDEERNKYQYAIEHILSDYKRVLKENEELKADNYELNNRITDLLENIPIQKIKDKIEYLKDYIEENSDEQGYWGNINPDVIYGQIEILEEVLKESEE